MQRKARARRNTETRAPIKEPVAKLKKLAKQRTEEEEDAVEIEGKRPPTSLPSPAEMVPYLREWLAHVDAIQEAYHMARYISRVRALKEGFELYASETYEERLARADNTSNWMLATDEYYSLDDIECTIRCHVGCERKNSLNNHERLKGTLSVIGCRKCLGSKAQQLHTSVYCDAIRMSIGEKLPKV